MENLLRMDESIPLEILELYGCVDMIEESLQNGDAATASARAAKTFTLIRNISESKRYNDRPLLKKELKNLEHQKIDAPPHLKRCGLIGARFLDAQRADHTLKSVVLGRHVDMKQEHSK